jgi:hypothetical protein
MSTAKQTAIAEGDVSGLVVALRARLATTQAEIPRELKERKGWLNYKVTSIAPTGKFNKIPIYPRSGAKRSGTQGAPADLANLGTWTEAWQAFQDNPAIAGVGFACLAPFGVVALDVDHCVVDGVIRADVEPLIEDTYCEFSPSGTGIRAFWLGSSSNSKNNSTGYELFHSKGFVTVTGDFVIGGDVPTLPAGLRAKLEALATANPTAETPIKASVKAGSVLTSDPRLEAIKSAGLYERDIGKGKHSICCPLEHLHSDIGRPPGDGDTTYFQPNTNGYEEGWIHCLHTHTNDQAVYWDKLGYNPAGEAMRKLLAGDGWPEPQPIPYELPPVPAFDLGLLPKSLRPWIADIAERMQISPDIPAIGAVTALSAAIGRRVQIMPKAQDDWTVVPNLWGVVVAPPGYMKSPALSEVMKPLHRLEVEAFKEHEAKMRDWSQEMERASILRAATKSATMKSLKSNLKGKIDIAAGDPDMPVAKRYTVNNFSLEALGEVLLANPDGVLAFSDEIHGLLMLAHKPGNEGLNDFLLSSWNGDGSHTFDRVGRGVRRVERCCIAVLGGIQPGRITEHVIGATSGGAGDSGLLQRFQLLTWPDIREKWQLVDRLPDMAARDVASEVFSRLAKKETPEDVFGNKEEDIRRFDAPAQAAFFAWLTDLEAELRGQDLPLVMASHLAKYRSLVPSLALIFAVADGVAGAVPLRYVEQSIGWADYLRPHAERAYACALRPDTRHAQALLDKIKAGAVTGNFKLADVYWKGWSQLDRDGAVKAAEVLCDLGYLLRDEVRNPSGGRPSVSFHINPKALN